MNTTGPSMSAHVLLGRKSTPDWEKQCRMAQGVVATVRVQIGSTLPESEVTFEVRADEKGVPWFSCPDHKHLGQFSGSVVPLLAEVLEAEGLLADR